MSPLDYSYTAEDEQLGGVLSGRGEGITVTVPLSLVRRLYRAARGVMISGDELGADEIAGFWDFARKVVNVVHEVAKSPIVRSVVGAIPGGGTALTVVETATAALKAADNAIKKQPAVHAAVAKAAAGDTRARAALAAIPRREVAKAAVLQKETADLAKRVIFLRTEMKKAGYTDALVRAIRSPRAPWHRFR